MGCYVFNLVTWSHEDVKWSYYLRINNNLNGKAIVANTSAGKTGMLYKKLRKNFEVYSSRLSNRFSLKVTVQGGLCGLETG